MGEQQFESKEEVPVVLGEVVSGGPRRLLRSRQNRVVAGVCGGIAEYFSLDPVLVRAVWAVLTVVTAIIPGLLLYVLVMVIVPENISGEPDAATRLRPRLDNRLLWGGLLILAGLYFLSRMIWGQVLPPDWLEAWNRFWGFLRTLMFPAVLIGAGVLVVLGLSRRTGEGSGRLVRPRQNRILAGVCSGLGRYFRVNPVWVRLVWVLLFLASWWAAVVGYVLAMLLMPEE